MEQEPFEKIFPKLSQFLSSPKRITWEYTNDFLNFASPADKTLQVYVNGYSDAGNFRAYIKSLYWDDYLALDKSKILPTDKKYRLLALDELIAYAVKIEREIITNFDCHGEKYEKFTVDSIFKHDDSESQDNETTDELILVKITDFVEAFKDEMDELAHTLRYRRNEILIAGVDHALQCWGAPDSLDEPITTDRPITQNGPIKSKKPKKPYSNDSGKNTAKSFELIDYDKNQKKMDSLFSALCNSKLLSDNDNTKYDFREVFSGNKIKNKILWQGSMEELYGFIKILHEKDISVLKTRGKKWIITCKCFVNKKGKPYNNVSLGGSRQHRYLLWIR